MRLIRMPLATASKRPLVLHWQRLEPDDPVWTTVAANIGSCNWGLRLDDLVVLDADSRAAVDWVERECPTATPYQTRGRPDRRSFWFSRPEGCELRTRRLAPDLELRTGPGAQQVIPPSIHPDTGEPYRWVGPGGDFTETLDPPPPAPVTWLEAIAPRDEPWSPGGSGGWDVIPEGHRDIALTSLAGQLRRHGASRRAIEEWIYLLNQRLCRPPLAERDVVRIARSVERYDPRVIGGAPIKRIDVVDSDGTPIDIEGEAP